jgi:hypothetical protein
MFQQPKSNKSEVIDLSHSSKKEEVKERTRSKFLDLIQHPRNENIVLSKARQGFIVTMRGEEKGQKYKGITSILRDVFWPNYVFRRYKYNGGTGVKNMQEGMSRGKKVHKEIEHWINKPTSEFSKKHPEPETHTLKIMNSLYEWGIKPVTAEFCIYDEGPKIATAIDALCTIKPSNELAIIDWKIGLDDYEFKGNGIIEKPPSLKKLGLTDSPMMHAFLQLMVETQILERKYGISPDKAYVVQANLKGVAKYEIPEEIWSLRRDVYDCLLDHMDKVKLEKEFEKNNKGKKRKVDDDKVKPKETKVVSKKVESSKPKAKKPKNDKPLATKNFFGPPKTKPTTVKNFFGPPKKVEPKTKPVVKKERVKKEKVKGVPKKRKRPVDPDLIGIKFPDD